MLAEGNHVVRIVVMGMRTWYVTCEAERAVRAYLETLNKELREGRINESFINASWIEERKPPNSEALEGLRQLEDEGELLSLRVEVARLPILMGIHYFTTVRDYAYRKKWADYFEGHFHWIGQGEYPKDRLPPIMVTPARVST